MKKIVEYYLISTTDSFDIDRQVNERIQQGWQPYGNPFSTVVNKEEDGKPWAHWMEASYNQAMVKYEE